VVVVVVFGGGASEDCALAWSSGGRARNDYYCMEICQTATDWDQASIASRQHDSPIKGRRTNRVLGSWTSICVSALRCVKPFERVREGEKKTIAYILIYSCIWFGLCRPSLVGVKSERYWPSVALCEIRCPLSTHTLSPLCPVPSKSQELGERQGRKFSPSKEKERRCGSTVDEARRSLGSLEEGLRL